MPSNRDDNHSIVSDALKNRCGGFHKDEVGVLHAYLKGLPICAVDMHKAGNGFPDWIVFVSWLAIPIEVKNHETMRIKGKAGFTAAELIFKNEFTGIYRVCYEQNEVYELLCDFADLVLWLEGQAEKLPDEYVRAFFPKVSLFPKSEGHNNG